MSIKAIITDIAALFDTDSAAILSRRRKRHICDARAVACYILHRKLGMSSTQAGRQLLVSHATVLHAVRNCEWWLEDSRINPLGRNIIIEICDKYKL